MIRKETVNQCNDAPPTLADALRAKRAAIVREANARTREIDRQLDMLKATEAESVIAEARTVLDEG
jgi:hypothetical protein